MRLFSFILGAMGALFLVQLLAAAEREGWEGLPAPEPERRPTFH